MHNPSHSGEVPFQPGQLVANRFQIIRLVAQGGMGIVWDAFDKKLDRRVALKSAKSGFGKQLPPEVRNAREISHPNVCRLFEIHTASVPGGEIDVISMEFLDGLALGERLRRSPIPLSEARAIAVQICSGLAEAHRHRLIHGDLKPGNIMLTKSPEGSTRAVITDFGLARRIGGGPGMFGGTPTYMAPELWRGAEPSVASDLYALGVVLWELRYGIILSDGRSSTLAAGDQVIWKPPVRRGKWDRVIGRCLHPDPARRFASATEVAEKLGPSRVLRQGLAAAATAALVIGSGAITYQRTAAPVEQVRLALLPLPAVPESASLGVLRATDNQLAALKSSGRTRLRFVSLDDAIRKRAYTPDEAHALLEATYALRAAFERHGDVITMRGYLTDLRSGADVRQWTYDYKPRELRYASVALTSLVTNVLHLPPPISGSGVNSGARPFYLAANQALRRDKTLDRATESFERAIAADPESAVLWAGLAEAQWLKYVVTNDSLWLTRFAESFKQAQLRNPDLAPVHRVEGLAKFRDGYYEQAAAAHGRAIEIEPRFADNYRWLGETYMQNGQNEEALAAFQKAIELDPNHYRNYQDLGDFYYGTARYKEAIAQFRKALSLAPGELMAKHHLCEAYMGDGQFAAAERDLREFLKDREEPSALHTLGVVLMYQSREREAVSMFLRAIKQGPELAVWWMNLGTSYRRLGLRNEARPAFHRAIDLGERRLIANPRDALLRSFLSYLYAVTGDPHRAQAEIAQALQAAPRNQDVRFMAAVVYEVLGQRPEVLTVLAECPHAVLEDVIRWPDTAKLRDDPRFQRLLTQN